MEDTLVTFPTAKVAKFWWNWKHGVKYKEK